MSSKAVKRKSEGSTKDSVSAKPAAKKIKAEEAKKNAIKAKPSKSKASSSSADTAKKDASSEPKRDKAQRVIFPDFPDFKPNLTPKEVLQSGSFGGTYFRPISSSVTGEKYKDVWKEYPEDWFEGLDIKKQVASPTYREQVNTYKVKCGGSLEMWESSGWILKQDPYGWFQWYCRFYLGRRTADDARQVGRWLKCAGVKGRWKNNLIGKIARSGCAFNNFGISPVVRQTLQHWGYRLTEEDYKSGAKRVKL